ncbi:membrane protein insertase YidC [Streptomyces bohaiensis]|uniref:Membrane protein insertase YidC n=1 Tax=Streptomyces bohaiensis TaxID=1431344 RepID=A0ABX1C9R0_9ACTN|nr:membrane protein insertase YidC [Streptomyces bohaiensis]NJQ14630.1 membrane protein insertase YidC [Streptomyces bohaiensis]
MNSILSPLYWIVSWIIVRFHDLYSLVFDEGSGWAWGLSIVSLVIVIRIALIPLFFKQIKATRNMQALQPQMKKIQERYKNDKQRQSEEMMKLYKETGTNPLSSCLPILAQSPFFIALFQVLNHIAGNRTVGVLNADQVESAREATIFGAPIATKFMDSAERLAEFDASLTNVRVVTVIMIILMSLSQFYTQRQLMTKNVDLTVKTPFMNQQKMLMYIFPILFAVFGINFPVGVLIYWLTTNVWTLGQQMYVINRNPTPGSLAFQQRQERLRKKGKLKEDPVEVETKQQIEEARANRSQPKRKSKSQRQGGPAPQVHKKNPQGKAHAARKRPNGSTAAGSTDGGAGGDTGTSDAGTDSTGRSDADRHGSGKNGSGKNGSGKNGSGKPQGSRTKPSSAKSKK